MKVKDKDKTKEELINELVELRRRITQLEKLDTQRKQAEEKLGEIEDHFHLLVNVTMNYAIFMLDPGGYVVSWNKGAERIKGYRAEEIIGQHFSCFYTSEDIQRGKPEQELREARATGQFEDEGWRLRKDGSRYWAQVAIAGLRDKNGNLFGFLKVVRDLTELKQMEGERVAALRKAEDVIEAMNDAVAIIDLDGTIRQVNSQFERGSGWKREEVIGKTMIGLGIMSKVESQRVEKELMPKLMKEGSVRNFETIGIRRNGTEFPALVSWSLLRNADGKPTGIIAIARDITELQKKEEKLKETLKELIRSNKELEQFIYVASHDLQEPLRMVSSYVQLLARRYKGRLDTDADDFIGYAVDGVTRMQKMVNDLLRYSRIGLRSRLFEPTDCEAVLDEVLANLRVVIEETGARITRDPLPTVMADKVKMVHLFQNLISNSIKFRGKEPCRIHISADRKEKEWVFSVRDNGMGIASEYFERIFVIFQRLQDRDDYPGTGVGLAICQKIVQGHGGRIWVESKPGKGATFYFTIPVRKETNKDEK